MKSVTNILPTIEADDLWYFLKTLFLPKGFYRHRVIQKLNEHFPDSHVFLFNSAREALSFLAKHTFRKNTELLTQAFTCSAVIYPFITNGIIPRYVDIDKKTLNIHYESLKKTINKSTQGLILQYTFGLVPEKLEEIFALARKHKMFIIEDLAHSFGNSYKGRPLGTNGDVAVLSFGKDKVISSVSGGALVVHSNTLAEQLKKEYEKLATPALPDILRLVFYLFFMSFIKPLYSLKLTRILIFALQLCGVLEKAVSPEEKAGKPGRAPHQMSPFVLPLLYHQLAKLEIIQAKRHANTMFYNRTYGTNYKGALLKYPLMKKAPKKIVLRERRNHLYLDSWYSNIIDPPGVDLVRYGYLSGSCKEAEGAASRVVNLPTLFRITRHIAD